MSPIKVRKVGNSLGLILPKEVQDILQISEGDTLEITPLSGQRVVLNAHLPHHSQWKFSKAPSTREDEQWLNADLEEDDDKAPTW